MVIVGQQRCKEIGCKKYALYNHHGETKKLYCQSHAKPGMVNVKRHVCIYNGCTTQPYYNYLGETVGKYCTKHALTDMIDVYTRMCKECSKIPSFNFTGEKYGKYCKEHSLNGMINVRSSGICQDDNCNTQASFGDVGTFTPIFCGKHKTNNMINLRKKTCQYGGCIKSALFNSDGSKSRKYCAEHKDDNMVAIGRKLCKYPNCNITASFGEFCKTHKKDGTPCNLGYKCKYIGCIKCASFNYIGLKPLYCGSHEKTGMKNVTIKYCTKKNCGITATFGYLGGFLQFCGNHHPVGTTLSPMRRCIIKNCNELALYGKKDHVYCEKHKQKGDINFVERICKKCNLLNIVDENEICKYCNPERWGVIRLAKQKEIEALFKKEHLDYISTDKIIENGACGKERPDFIFDGASHFVVVEVDEDQHKSRACECEQTRMVNVSQSLGMPTIFLRYNPDRYIVNGKCQDVTRTSRHKTLINWLTKLLILEPKELAKHGFLSVVHLYFDNFNPHKVVWETILNWKE
jgi:hypothetical protein